MKNIFLPNPKFSAKNQAAPTYENYEESSGPSRGNHGT